jgi:chaperonin cofactor prefoldin
METDLAGQSWSSEVAQLDEVKRLKTAAYAQKAKLQAMRKELAKAIKELAKVDSDQEVWGFEFARR